MTWYIDHARAAKVKLRPRALVIVEMLRLGHLPQINAGTFDAVMDLLEADVLLHTEYQSLSDRIKHLGSMIEEKSDDA